MYGLAIVFPLTPALMTAIAGLCFFATKQIKPLVPQKPNQNLVVRIISIALGVAMGVLAFALTPSVVWSINAAVGAAIQGGAAGAGVTAAVWAAYTAVSTPAAPTK